MQVGAFFAAVALVVVLFFSGLTITTDTTQSTPDEAGGGFVLPSFTNSIGSPADAQPVQTVESTAEPVSVAQAPTTAATDTDAAVVAAPEPTADPLPPTAFELFSVQDIEYSSALVRGQVIVGNEVPQTVFFVFDYERSDIDRVDDIYSTYAQVTERRGDIVYTSLVANTLSASQAVATRLGDLAPDTTYYVRLCGEMDARLRCTGTRSFETIARVTSQQDARYPVFSGTDVVHVTGESVQFVTNIDMNDMHDGEVYVVYGESLDDINQAYGQEYSDIDEDGDDLQRVRVYRNLRGSLTLFETVDDLDDNTVQYYFWCVEFDGLDDGVVCDRIYSERTYDEDFGLTPDLRIDSVTTSNTIASLQGSADMDEFRNGIIFFVYGTNQNAIASLGGTGTFVNVRQNGDRLQKRLVDDDLDRSDEYSLVVADLLSETTYSVRLCAEYENQNSNYNQAQFIACSAVETVSTR